MDNRNTILVYLFLLLCCCNCSNPNSDDVIVNINDEFIVDLLNVYENETATLHLLLETIADTECTNSSIQVDKEFLSDAFRINIRNIDEPEACDPGVAPARISIPLKSMDRTRTYQIEINLSGQVFNTGTLKYESGVYHLDMDTFNGIVVKNDQLSEIPEDIYWGFYAYNNQIQGDIDLFSTELESLVNDADTPDGYYGHFDVNDYILDFDFETNFSNKKKLFFKFNRTEEELIEFLDSYRSQDELRDHLEIHVFNYKAESI